MKMSTHDEREIIRKDLDSVWQMMHVALVLKLFPTHITGRAIVADVEGFFYVRVELFHH